MCPNMLFGLLALSPRQGEKPVSFDSVDPCDAVHTPMNLTKLDIKTICKRFA